MYGSSARDDDAVLFFPCFDIMVDRDRTQAHHGGDIDGMRCQTGMIPELNLGIVIFSNLHPSTLVEALLFSVFDAFIGGEARDWSSEILALVKEFEQKTVRSTRRKPPLSAAKPSPSLPMEKYAGLYENNLYGQAQVIYENGQLKIHLGQIEVIVLVEGDDVGRHDVRYAHEGFSLSFNNYRARSVLVNDADGSGATLMRRPTESRRSRCKSRRAPRRLRPTCLQRSGNAPG